METQCIRHRSPRHWSPRHWSPWHSIFVPPKAQSNKFHSAKLVSPGGKATWDQSIDTHSALSLVTPPPENWKGFIWLLTQSDLTGSLFKSLIPSVYSILGWLRNQAINLTLQSRNRMRESHLGPSDQLNKTHRRWPGGFRKTWSWSCGIYT